MTKIQRGSITRIACAWDAVAVSTATVGVFAFALADVPTPVLGVTVQNDPGNGEVLFVGNVYGQHFQLAPGSHIDIPVCDLSLVYVRSGGGTVTVNWTTTAPGGLPQTYAQKVLSYNPIAYWPLWETSGTVAQCLINAAQNGTYARDVAIMGTAAGIGDGNTAPVFNGANDVVDVYSAALASVFDGAEGTLALWAKVSAAGVWTDGILRSMCTLRADADNQLRIEKNNNNNRVRWLYEAAADVDFRDENGVSTVEWNHYALTWDDNDNQAIAYRNGTQIGVALTPIGTWAGALNSARTVIGADSNIPLNAYDGYLQHVPIFDRALTLAEIKSLTTV